MTHCCKHQGKNKIFTFRGLFRVIHTAWSINHATQPPASYPYSSMKDFWGCSHLILWFFRRISCQIAVGRGVTMYWIQSRHGQPWRPAWKLLEGFRAPPPIQGGHCRKNQHFHGEDKHKPAAIASLRTGVESVFRCYSTTCQAVWRRGGPDKDRMGLGWWVGGCAPWVWLTAQSRLAACCSEARGQNRTQRGTGSSRPFGASLMPARNEIWHYFADTFIGAKNFQTDSTSDLILLCPPFNLGDIR